MAGHPVALTLPSSKCPNDTSNRYSTIWMSKRILDMTNEQNAEIEIEERLAIQRKLDRQSNVVLDSDEEEIETEEIFIDEEDE